MQNRFGRIITYFGGLETKAKPPELYWIPEPIQWVIPLTDSGHVL